MTDRLTFEVRVEYSEDARTGFLRVFPDEYETDCEERRLLRIGGDLSSLNNFRDAVAVAKERDGTQTKNFVLLKPNYGEVLAAESLHQVGVRDGQPVVDSLLVVRELLPYCVMGHCPYEVLQLDPQIAKELESRLIGVIYPPYSGIAGCEYHGLLEQGVKNAESRI